MRFIKQTVLGAAAALAFSGAANAALINVGGVVWDPESNVDFTGKTGFYQWFQGGATGLNADGSVTIANSLTPVGNYLTGVGNFTVFDTANNIPGIPNPETTPAVFCPGCELTYTFGGIKVTGFTGTQYTVDLTDAYINLFVDYSRNFNDSLGTAYTSSDVAKAADGNLFLAGMFNTFNINSVGVVGSALAGTVDAVISALSGPAFGNFDTNTQPFFNVNGFGLGDLTYTGSSQFRVGTAFGAAAQHATGTGETQGDTIPEPGTLALLGLALAGLGAAKRRKAA